ncbi:FCD domain-containing protein [Marinomonas sp. 2405UD68-3]|uniref:FCD domain-containing protein n=1 Tax=Marinomonas sp. 2405UD68-3 TaxID=3391835 RepID=UPI0039C9635C
MSLSANAPKRLYQKIGLLLRDRIYQGKFRIGERLPPEREIAEQMQVSRVVIREALIMLELQGLVEVRKGSGIYVIHNSKETPAANSVFSLANNSNVSASSLFNEQDDVGPFEMLQARQILESHVIELSAKQITKKDIFRLREALEMERQHLAGKSSDYDGDELFHTIIAEASQNSVLADMVKELWVRRQKSSMWRQLHCHTSNQDYRQRWLSDHEKILAALQRKNPVAAKQEMWQHLENVKQVLLQFSDVDDPEFDGFLFNAIPNGQENP